MRGEARARVSDRPPLWAIAGTLLAGPLFIGTVLVLVPFLLTGWRFAPPLFGWEPCRWIGALLIVGAVPVVLDFLVRFVREGHGTPVPLAPPRRLVTGGSFRFVRNPAYLSALVALIGQALLFGSVPVLVYTLAIAALSHLFIIAVEEPALRKGFGPEYERYCRNVPRWLPRWGGRNR